MAEHSTTKIAELTVDIYQPRSGAPKGSLMFCHGAWVGGWIWGEFPGWFADRGYTAYVPTWRGRYDSKPVSDLGAVSMYDFIEDALAVARSVTPDVVIGESLGGLIAQKTVESYKAKALVLMNSAPAFMVPANPTVTMKQLKYLGDLLFKKPNLPNEQDYKQMILNNVAEPEASEIYKKLCPESGRALMEASLGKIKVDVAKVNCPVYVIAGHKDVLLPIKVHRKTAKLLGAEIVEYPAMSHHTFAEEGWEKVAQELDGWLSEKLGTTAFA